MTRSSHRAFGALVLSASLLLAACGSSGGDDAKDTTTTAADDATTTTAAGDETTTTEADDAPVDEEAQARAESIDLTVSDFPDGWEATPSEDSGEEGPIAECDPATADDSDELASYSTDDFSLGDLAAQGTGVTVETKVFTDEEAATAALAPFSDEEVLTCVNGKIQDEFAATGEFTADTIDEGTFAVDEAAAASGQYSVGDGSTTLNLGVLVLRTGDIATLVTIFSTDPEFTPDTIKTALDQIATLQAAA